MTGKRFVKGYHTIRDIKENNTYDFQVNIICDLLNELDGKWIGEFSLRETLQQELQRVENENEQLKQELISLSVELDTHKHPLWSTREAERKVSELTELLADEVKKNGELLRENNLLRIENKRLLKHKKDFQ